MITQHAKCINRDTHRLLRGHRGCEVISRCGWRQLKKGFSEGMDENRIGLEGTARACRWGWNVDKGVLWLSKYAHISLKYLRGTPLRCTLDIFSKTFLSAKWPASLQSPNKFPISSCSCSQLGVRIATWLNYGADMCNHSLTQPCAKHHLWSF